MLSALLNSNNFVNTVKGKVFFDHQTVFENQGVKNSTPQNAKASESKK